MEMVGNPCQSTLPSTPFQYLVWCDEKCHKPDNRLQRNSYAEIARKAGTALLCIKKANRFATWLCEKDTSPYVLIVAWREAKPCIVAYMSHDQAKHPFFTMVVCESPAQFSRASAWAAKHDPVKRLHVCKSTESAIECFAKQCGGLAVNAPMGTFSVARSANQLNAGSLAQAQKPVSVKNLVGKGEYFQVQATSVQAPRPPSKQRYDAEDSCPESSSCSSEQSSTSRSHGWNQASITLWQSSLPMTSNARGMSHQAVTNSFPGAATQQSLGVKHTRRDWSPQDKSDFNAAIPAADGQVAGCVSQVFSHHVCEGKFASPAIAPDSEAFVLSPSAGVHNHDEFLLLLGKINWDMPTDVMREDLKVLEDMLVQAMPDHYDE